MQSQFFRTIRVLLFPILFSLPNYLAAQCEVEISAVIDSNVCGDCLTLTAFGQGQGQQVFEENFNSGNPSGWAFTQQATFTNPCSPNGVDNTPHIWMGDLSSVPRALETIGYDLTPASAGVTICFDLLFAEQGGAAPCEGPDEPDEGVAIQYSINNGASWTDIHYFDPNGGYDANLINWNNWCFPVPAAAITTNTKFRWFQDADSGAEYDHWGIDNVNIYYNDPTYDITWDHDNYSYGVGNSGGDNPNLICPKVTTTYVVEMTNGNFTCKDSVTVIVVDPSLEVSAGNDTTVCDGNCAQLNGTAKVIKRPAKTPTYANTQTQAITTGIGGNTEVNINIVDLNMTNILPGSITEVCIDNLTFFGVSIFPPGQQTIGELEVRIFCPDGSSILLIPSGVTTSSSPLEGYSNTCFTPVSTSNIGTANPPYSGSFMPGQSLDNLAGCTANGIWTMQITSTSPLSLGSGSFTGWSISFDDPEISYDADFTWSPTTNMTGANTLSPVVCPTSSRDYTLTASDSAGCITRADIVSVTVEPVCCVLEYTGAVVEPSCGNSDGSITLNISQGSGNYDINWSNSQSGMSITNLAAGVYSVTIEDLGQAGCLRDTSFTLSNPGAPIIVGDTAIAETCLGANDGAAGVVVMGGTAPYSFLWSNNAIDSVIFNLAPGNYTLTVSDDNGCETNTSLTVNAGPNCCNIAVDISSTNPDCGQNNGSITATVLNGSGNYTYDWTPAATGNTLSNLAAGTYQLTVEDINQANCTHDTSITLSGVVLSGVTVDTAICANDPITIDGVVIDAAGSYTYTLQTTSGCDSVINLNVTTIQAIGRAPEPDFFNTANDGSGNTLAGGTNDLNWEVAANDINGPYNPAVVMTGIPPNYYNSPFPDAEWISHSANGTHSGRINYFYKIEFELPCMDSCGRSFSDQNAFCLALDFFSDNSVFEIYINGAAQSSQIAGLPIAGDPYTHTGFQQSGMLSVVLCDDWHPGTNTMILEVRSEGGYAGFLSQTSVNTPPFVFAYDTIPTSLCETDTITVDGVDIYAAGLYTFQLVNSFGCDSNIVLDVNLLPRVFTDIYDTICSGEQYVFNNNSYGQIGVYADTLQSALTCDSIVTLYLHVNEIASNLQIQAAQCNTSDGSIEVIVDSSTVKLPLSFSIDGLAFGANPLFDNLAAGNYTVYVADDNGCMDTLSAIVTEANNTLVLNLTSNDLSCFNANDGSVTASASSANPPLQYNWNTGSTDTFITNLPAGTYSVVVTDQNNCSQTDSVTLTNPAELTLDLGPNFTLCFGETQDLDAGDFDTYQWSTGDSTRNITVGISGTYEVSVTDANGCMTTASIQATIGDSLAVSAGNDTSIVEFNAAQLHGLINGGTNPSGQYIWSPSYLLSCDDCLNPLVKPMETQTFVLSYTEGNCTEYDTITVEVLEGEYYLYMPTAFSPNGDGINDIYAPVYAGVDRWVFQIFDRWGELLFESRDLNQHWDGYYKGKELKPGVYVYHIYAEFINLETSTQTGSLTIIR